VIGAPDDANKGGVIVKNQSAVSSRKPLTPDSLGPEALSPNAAKTLIPTARYNDFLFAPIYEEANGTALTVLSALARLDVDPWEEASRLAAMPKANAAGALVAMLDLIPDGRWSKSELEKIAARLAQLLPQTPERATIVSTAGTKLSALQQGFWVAWLVLTLVMSLVMSHFQQTTTNPNVSAPETGTSSPSTSTPSNSGRLNATSPAAGDEQRQ
jgi:hypothetical protein